MNLTKDQIQSALAAGLALTSTDSDAPIPMRHASGALILHQLLLAIGSGQVQLLSPPPAKPPVDEPPVDDGEGDDD